MSEQREAFEVAWAKRYPNHSQAAFKLSLVVPGMYANTRVNDGWAMWQVSRAAALEEAALTAERYPNPCGHTPWAAHTVDMTCVEVGRAIRALKEQS